MDLSKATESLTISPPKKQNDTTTDGSHATSKCPIADTSRLPDFKVQQECPFHKQRHEKAQIPSTNKNKNAANNGFFFHADEVLRDIGGGDKIRQMCTRFYAHAFEDQTLSKFMFVDDCAAAHGQRLGDWFVERMGGEGTPWTDSGRHGKRQYSHFRAWNSSKRTAEDRGKRFKLDDCRIWMRLMFWSMREVGLDKNPKFVNLFVPGIESLIGIYERSAPSYARKDYRWSEKQKNVDAYLNNDFLMKDVVGKGRY